MSKKRKPGRPTKYREKFIQIANDYCDETELPYVEELALKLGVWKEAVYNWGKKYKEFSYALKKIKQKQEFQLLRGTLSRKVNAAGAMFQLKCNHGYIETEKKIVEGGDKPLNIDIVDYAKKK